MKLKIAILSAAVLTVILGILGTFIYFTLNTRILQLQGTDLGNQAQAIAQYYSSHSTDGQPNDRSVLRWVAHYTRRDQEVLLIRPDGTLIDAFGDLGSKDFLDIFQPTDTMQQQSVTLKNKLHALYTELPITNEQGNKTIGYVAVAGNIGYIQEYMESLLTVLIAGSIGAILLAGAGGYVIAAAGVKPIRQLIHVVERIEANRLNERVEPPKSRDEVARLSITFNHMLSRIERSFEQQMRFVADASHEIRTPLTTILGYANLLDRWGKTDAAVLDKSIQVIRKESLRLRHLADDLLLLAGLEASRSERSGDVYVDEVVGEVTDELAVLHPDVAITRNLAAEGKVLMTAYHLRQVATNVIGNALKYTPVGGTVAVNTHREDDMAVIQVTDTGCGIPVEDLPHVFERFYRADKSRERAQGGNGLGLAIVKELVQSYRGTIDIDSVEGEGTTVTMRLPMEV